MKKVLFILGIVVAATLGVVLIVQPGKNMKKGQRIQLPGIQGQTTEYYRIDGMKTDIVNMMSQGAARIPKSDKKRVSAEELPGPIRDNIATSFGCYRIRNVTMITKDKGALYKVVVQKGFSTKTLYYETAFIIKKRWQEYY